ncbi:thiolase family protein [Chloroflexota bacterium]
MAALKSLKDQACIVGVGESEYSSPGKRDLGRSGMSLCLEAITAAVDDAGLTCKDIDGIIPTGRGVDIPAEAVAANLGVNMRYSAIIQMGGASSGCGIQTAAQAVATGAANYIVLYYGGRGYSGMRVGRTDQPRAAFLGGNSGFEAPYGWIVFAQRYAMMYRRHMHEYGTTSRQMAAIAVAMRKHACLNEKAYFRTPMTIEDHQNSRVIADPFRLLDCCMETDGVAAVIVTTAERARDCRKRPVYISGAATGYPPFPDSLARRSVITEFGIKYAAPRAFAMAGVTNKDIQFAEVYDCFTYNMMCQLEDMGFCKKGEGGSFVEGGRIELGGELPTNTHGGLLSQAHIGGMNHQVEAVKQLREDAGAAQVKDAHVGLVTSYGLEQLGSILILSS